MTDALFKFVGYDALPVRAGALATPYVRKTRPTPYRSANVHHISLGPNATNVEITRQPGQGWASVNPDGTIALVLTEVYVDRWKDIPDEPAVFSMDVRFDLPGAPGLLRTLSIQATSVEYTHRTHPKKGHRMGWGSGQHYVMPLNAEGGSHFEPGPDHRSIHVTTGAHAWTAAMIEAEEGLEAGTVDAAWLVGRLEYGTTTRPLEPELGADLLRVLNDDGRGSVWLLCERGQAAYYDEAWPERLFIGRPGHSPIHPMILAPWGEGSPPVVSGFRFQATYSHCAAFLDCHWTKEVGSLGSRKGPHRYIMVDNVMMVGHNDYGFQGVAQATVRRMTVNDSYRDEARASNWSIKSNRLSGLYTADCEDMLIEDFAIDQAAWRYGYDWNGDINFPQSPSFYSHAMYLQDRSFGTTVRRVFTSRPAFSNQFRSGGAQIDCLFAHQGMGSNYKKGTGDPPSNYPLVLSTAIVGQRTNFAGGGVAGASGRSFQLSVEGATFDDCLVLNGIDPQNPNEEMDPTVVNVEGSRRLVDKGSYVSVDKDAPDELTRHKVVMQYRWGDHPDIIPPGYSTDDADLANLFDWAAQPQHLGNRVTNVKSVFDYIRTVPEQWKTGQDIREWLFAKVGRNVGKRQAGTTQRFIPSPLCEGIRWDVRLNWSGNSIPGDHPDDVARLGANRVRHNVNGGIDAIRRVDLEEGTLLLDAGLLAPRDGIVGPGTVRIDHCGQLRLKDHSGQPVAISMVGGQFRNMGTATALPLTIDGRPQRHGFSLRPEAVLAVPGGTFTVDDHITVIGTDAAIGVEGGEGTARLVASAPGATLRWVASSAGLSPIRKIITGLQGVDPVSGTNVPNAVTFDVTLGAAIEVDVTARAGSFSARLIVADALTGTPSGVTVEGLGARNATVTISGSEVAIAVTATGTGQVTVNDGR